MATVYMYVCHAHTAYICTCNIRVLSKRILRDVERVLLYGQASTSKLIDPPLYHVEGKLVMKTCWTDMPCNCWGEH